MAFAREKFGFGEHSQRGWVLDDPVGFAQLMFELYSYRCAVTGRRFAPVTSAAHPDLEVFLFQPRQHQGQLRPGNAIVVDIGAAGLLAKGILLVSDALEAYVPDPLSVELPGVPAPSRLHLPDDPHFWPDRDLIAYHRSLFRTQ